MVRSLGQLTVDLVARIAGFEQGMDRAARISDKRMKEIEARAKKFGNVLGLAVAGAATALGAAVIAGTKNVIDLADQMDELSQRTGVSAEQLSKWSYAAQLSGTDLDGLTRGITLLSKNMAAAADEGSKQGQLFRALGIDVKDAAGNLRDVEDILPEIADRFQQLDNTTTETALAMQLFGKSGAELLEFLNRGGVGINQLGQELSDLGGVIDNETAAAAAAFKDEIDRLKVALNGVWIGVARELLPILTDLVSEFKDVSTNGSEVSSVARDIANGVREMVSAAKELGSVIGYVRQFGEILMAVQDQADAYGRATNAFFTFNRDKMNQAAMDVESSARRIDKAWSAITTTTAKPVQVPRVAEMDFSRPAPADGPALEGRINRLLGGESSSRSRAKGGKSEAEREAESLKRAYESLNESLAERVALFGKEGEAARVAYQIQQDSTKVVDEATRALQQSALARAQEIDQLELMEDLHAAARKEVEANTEAYERERQQVDDFVKSLEAEILYLSATTDQRYRLLAVQEAGANATEAEIDAMEKLLRKRDDMLDVNRNWEDLNRNIADSLFDIVSGAESAEDAIKNFFDALHRQILSNITDDWANSITDWLKGFGQGAGGGGGSGFWGNLFGSLFGGGKAGGGWANPNTVYEVNERGIEMATVGGRDYMLTGSRPVEITPNHRLGGGGSVTQVFNNPIMSNLQTDSQRAREQARKAQREMARA